MAGRVRSLGHNSVWAGTVWDFSMSGFAPPALSSDWILLIKRAYSLGWDRWALLCFGRIYFGVISIFGNILDLDLHCRTKSNALGALID